MSDNDFDRLERRITRSTGGIAGNKITGRT